MTFANRGVYSGNFVKNEIQGYGTYEWRDGRVYKGQWKVYNMDGEGIITWPSGK